MNNLQAELIQKVRLSRDRCDLPHLLNDAFISGADCGLFSPHSRSIPSNVENRLSLLTQRHSFHRLLTPVAYHFARTLQILLISICTASATSRDVLLEKRIPRFIVWTRLGIAFLIAMDPSKGSRLGLNLALVSPSRTRLAPCLPACRHLARMSRNRS